MITTSPTPPSLAQALEAESLETRRMLIRNRLVLQPGESIPEAWPARILITTPHKERSRYIADQLIYEGYTTSILIAHDDYRIEGIRL